MTDLIKRVRAMQLRGNTPPYEMAHLKDDIIAALSAAHEPDELARECEWTCGAITSWDAEEWHGDCGAVWTFIEDGPVENEMNHCPKCGGKVRVKVPDHD